MFLSILANAQATHITEEKKVQQVIISFFDALSDRDSVSLKNYCTTDIQLYENGATWNLDSLVLKAIILNTAADFKRKNSFEFLQTTTSNEMAWATYHLRSEVIRGGKQGNIHWLETVILVKKNKQWQIKVLHSTLIKREG